MRPHAVGIDAARFGMRDAWRTAGPVGRRPEAGHHRGARRQRRRGKDVLGQRGQLRVEAVAERRRERKARRVHRCLRRAPGGERLRDQLARAGMLRSMCGGHANLLVTVWKRP